MVERRRESGGVVRPRQDLSAGALKYLAFTMGKDISRRLLAHSLRERKTEALGVRRHISRSRIEDARITDVGFDTIGGITAKSYTHKGHVFLR